MKTIKNNKKFQRTNDADAENLVKTKGWKYCPKSEWKEKVRDVNKKEETKKSKKKRSKKKK